ncbi:Retinoblastoma-related protein [Camellia lanceoleosa]|uniref:Retinoblastoma-related protein n=1 Tax=Camellia lanceoleosa TaxID=1840588 RepID=A0ACC0GFW4_9ERIC|nr:Retinoblastoma-related protein [Camellia lanceoleosa]
MHKFFVTFVFPSIDGLIYFKDLLEDTSLSSSLNILENDYADATRNKSELDERVFVNKEDSLLGSGSSSGGAMNISGAKKIDSIASPTRTSISPGSLLLSAASHAKLFLVTKTIEAESDKIGTIKSSFSFMVGTVCGIYIAQNYNVPNIQKLANTAIFMAKHNKEKYRNPKKGDD